MSKYSHPSRARLSMMQQSAQDGKTKTQTMYSNDSDSDENVIGPPKLSEFGSALLTDHNSNTFTKFQHFRHNHSLTHTTTNGTKYPIDSKIRRTVSELDESINQDISSPTSSSSIFANTINQTSIRPTSMTTLQSNHTNSGLVNNGTDTLQRMKDSIMKDELASSEKILERRNNRRISRTSSNHSTMNLNTSNTREMELSGSISSINNPITTSNSNESFQRLKTLQQNLKDEATSKYVERRHKRFLNMKRMSRLGPAKRASEIVGSEIDHALTTTTSESHESHDGKVNIKDMKNESKPTIDYSNIEFGDLNPLQYLKKHNIPTTELPQIAKIYFQNQKKGNRAHAIRKRSMTPVVTQKRFNDTDDINRVLTRSKTELSSTSNDKENIGVFVIDHNVNQLTKKREALTNIQLNQKEPEFKRMKSDPEQLNKMAVQEEIKIVNEPHKVKPVKKVAIQEPTASKRYHRHENNNNNSANRNPIIMVNETEYEKVELLGRGGSSKVYKVKGPSNKVYALKRVAFDEFDDSSIDGFKGEIALLERLRNRDRVVQLFDYEMTSGVLYLIMECGDYDLSYVLNQKLKQPLDIEFIRYYAREMIKCVDVVHDADIVHSDLKPANFVFVKGMLKIIDFGIANAVPDHTVNIYRETQIGTPNYMAPEALVAMNYANDGQSGNRWKVGKPSDVWSIGCIIYQMVYGKPPYAGFQGQNRLLAIMNPEVKIMFPDKTSKDEIVPRSVIDLMKDCLHRDPNKRLTTDEMLQTGFFNPIMVSESFIRNLIKNAVYFGCEQGEVSDGKIDDLANDVINRLGEFKI